MALKMFSIAVVQKKNISCHCANKSCLLQVVHTKAIAALTQLCDFYYPVWSLNTQISFSYGTDSPKTKLDQCCFTGKFFYQDIFQFTNKTQIKMS